MRKHGLTIDSLLAADIVTADGELLRADAESHPDLFWAIRGGGGNFGVVTRFLFRLHEVGTIVGGMLILPATAETIAGFIAAAEAAPDELSTIANVMPAPPMPFLAPEHHGKLVVMAHAGPRRRPRGRPAGGRALPRARRRRSPTWSGRCPTRRSTRPRTRDYHPLAVAQHAVHRTAIGRDEAAAILARLEASDAPMRVAQLRVLGGAMARVPADATAFAHRASRIMVDVAAFHDGRPRTGRARQAWVDELAAALRQDDARRLRQLPRRRGRGARPRGLPGRDLGSARRRQAPLRPDEPLPPEPERPAGCHLRRR